MSRNIVPLLTESGIFIYEGNTAAKPTTRGGLYYYDNVQKRLDTIKIFPQIAHRTDKKIMHIKSYSSVEKYGLFGYHGPFCMEYSDERKIFYPSNFPVIWSSNKDVHFHEVFCDTIFCIKDRTLQPKYVFNFGNRHFPVSEHGKSESTKDYLAVTYVMETSNKIYFQCVEDIYGEFQVYNGLYWKENAKVIMSKGYFIDDLTGFIPFRPFFYTEKGEFVGILTVEQIQEWLEEHPNLKLEGALAPLKNLKFDDNPVVVIVEP